MLSFRQLIIVVLSANLCRSFATDTKVVEHGEKCKTLQDCNRTLGLYCNNGACACLGNMHFNKETKKCTARVGDICKYPPGFESNNVDYACPPHAECEPSQHVYRTVIIPKSIQNIVNSLRSTHGSSTCNCKTGYAPDLKRESCVLSVHYGEKCSAKSAAKCDVSMGLICGPEETCTCREGFHFDKKLQRCAKKLSANCTMEDQCEEGTVCSLYLVQYRAFLYRYQSRIAYTAFKQREHVGHCVCAPGTTPNADSACVGNFRAACSDEEPCHTAGFLSCVDSICQCDKGMSSVFEGDEHGGSCRVMVGGACSEKGPKCTGNATCVDGHCKVQCEIGFAPTPLGTCLATHDKSCDVATGKLCNNFEGLACVNKKCSCFDSSLTWNKKANLCVAKVDEHCGRFKISNADIGAISTSDPLYALGTSGAELYIAGCEDGTTCFHDVLTDLNICRKH